MTRLCNHPEHAQYGLGHIKGPPLKIEYAAAPFAALPAEYSRTVVAPVLNQGSTPECEGYTAVTGRRITQPPVGEDGFDPNDIFRLAGGTSNGTTTAAIEKALLSPGASCTSGPNKGARLPVKSCQNIATLTMLKSAVMNEQFAGLAVDWYESWFNPLAGGMLPEPSGGLAGGHIFPICGWDDTRACPDGTGGALICQNSWGTNWGANGYFAMPYSYLGSPLEAYTQIAMPATPVTVPFIDHGADVRTARSIDCIINLDGSPTPQMIVQTIRKGTLGGRYSGPAHTFAEPDGTIAYILDRNFHFS